MTNRVLWLLSYVGLSLALSLGSNNRLPQTTSVIGAGAGPAPLVDTGAAGSSIPMAPDNSRGAASEQHYRRRRGTGFTHSSSADWLTHDKHAGSDNAPVLLGDVMSAVLGNYYRQRQAVSGRAEQLLPTDRKPSSSSSYLYREDLDDDEDNELLDEMQDDDDDDDPESSHPRRYGGSGDFLDQQQQQQRYGLAIRPEPAPPRPPGKRNQSPGGSGAKDSKQQMPLPAAALASAGANMASQFMMRSARGSRQYDVPQIGEFSFFFFLSLLHRAKPR